VKPGGLFTLVSSNGTSSSAPQWGSTTSNAVKKPDLGISDDELLDFSDNSEHSRASSNISFSANLSASTSIMADKKLVVSAPEPALVSSSLWSVKKSCFLVYYYCFFFF
jgi:hypothetical protein